MVNQTKDNKYIAKNRCYVIKKNEDTYAYISVKKDLYTEGITADNKTILVGYFSFYNALSATALDENLEPYGQNGIILYPDLPDNKLTLYRCQTDEFGPYGKQEKQAEGFTIQEITDESIIKDINFLIRSGIRNLNKLCTAYYKETKQDRYENLRELIQELIHEKDTLEISNIDELIKDLQEYLKILDTRHKKPQEEKTKQKTKVKKKQK